jgi:hypothetical protein
MSARLLDGFSAYLLLGDIRDNIHDSMEYFRDFIDALSFLSRLCNVYVMEDYLVIEAENLKAVNLHRNNYCSIYFIKYVDGKLIMIYKSLDHSILFNEDSVEIIDKEYVESYLKHEYDEETIKKVLEGIQSL